NACCPPVKSNTDDIGMRSAHRRALPICGRVEALVTPTRRGRREESKTLMADYDDGCRKSISTKCPTKNSRTSSSLPISRRENASGSRRHSRQSSKSLAKTCKSGSHKPVAPRSRLGTFLISNERQKRQIAASSVGQPSRAQL